MEEGVTGQQVMNMLFMTQHYDTISRLAEEGVNTIFVPYSPGTVGDLQTQIQSSLLAADTVTKSTTPADLARVKKKGPGPSRASDLEIDNPEDIT